MLSTQSHYLIHYYLANFKEEISKKSQPQTTAPILSRTDATQNVSWRLAQATAKLRRNNLVLSTKTLQSLNRYHNLCID